MNSRVSLILQPITTPWSQKADSLQDLLNIYGSGMDQNRARKWLQSFAEGDFSGLPPVVTLPAERMPGLWGGYSRTKNRIYLSEDCPPEHLGEVLLEEVGHFLDRELCASETPGEEGARFAALVLGHIPSAEQIESWAANEGWGWLSEEGVPVLVEGAKKRNKSKGKNYKSSGSSARSKKIRLRPLVDSGGGGSSSGGVSPTPASNQPPKPSDNVSGNVTQSYPGQTLTGNAGSIFVLSDPENVTIVGNLTGIETIQTDADGLDLETFAKIENVSLTGGGNIGASGNSLDNVISGNSGHNTLSGREGNDTLIGLAGNDSLDGGTGNDSMVGGTGDDTIVVDSVADVVVEGANQGTDWVKASVSHSLGDNVEKLELTGASNINATGNDLGNSLIGNGGNNSLSGLGGNDTIGGGSGNDTLLGGIGEDLIDGGTGSDRMVGGADNDTYIVDAGDTVVESENEGVDEVQASVDHTLSENVERLVLTGTAIAGMGNSLANTLIGNANANSLHGAGGIDSLIGGAGNDTYFVDDAGDSAFENAAEGTDMVSSSVNHTLGANIEHLVLTGTAQKGKGNDSANSLAGNALSNSLDGGVGVDTMIGGAGSDTYFVDSVSDVVKESANEGVDLVEASVGGYTLAANVENLSLSGLGNLAGSGNALNNTITGNSGNNSLSGGGGNDTILGGDGNDSLYGGTGNDSLLGGVGADSLVGGGGQDTLLGGSGNDTFLVNPPDTFILDGGEGNDLLRFASNSGMTLGDGDFGGFVDIESFDFSGVAGDVNITIGSNAQVRGIATLSGGTATSTLSANADYSENVHFTGGASADSLTGNSGNDTLLGLAGNDTIVAGVGNDILDGGSGNDSLTGGTGNDTYAVDSANDVVIEAGGGGADVVRASFTYTLGDHIEALELTGSAALNGTGNAADNTITGNSGNNVLAGMEGGDTILGGDGNDSLDGGTGNDSMVGGAGADTYMVDAAGDVVVEAASGGTDLVRASITYTLGDHIEALELTGSAALSATGNATANTITGNSGNNSLSGEGGNDTILGGDGDDSIDGGTGNDSMAGGAGNDMYAVDSATDVILEAVSGGADTVISSITYTLGDHIEALELTGSAALHGTGNAADNTITGNSGNNVLAGLGGSDTILGGDGNDSLDGGTGNDSMVGGAGADTYMVDAAGDVVVEAASGGTDVVRASISYTLGENLEALELTGSAALNGTGNALNNTITGNNGNNSLSGEGGNDTLLGAAGNDTLLGAAGDDSLQGGDGADSLVGGGGQDTLLGGAGNDTLVVNPPDHFIVDGGAGNDLLQFVTNSGMTLGDGDFGQFSSIESFDFSGVAGDVEIAIGSNARSLGIATLSGGMLNSSLTANADYAGNVHFTGGAGADSLTGNSGNDSLLGLGGNDTLVGGTGNDMLDGGTGNDSMVGGAGHDTYTVDSATDLIVEAVGVGTDVVRASITFTLGANLEVLELTGSAALNGTGNSADNTIAGNTGNNVLSGMGGNDTLLGGDGNDSLDGGTGNDSMVGGTGHDTYTVDAAGDAVLEAVGEGFDLVKSSLSYTLGANLEALELTGSDAIHGTGNATDNSITGNSGNNSLFGLEGNDTILGGDGDDTLFAGEGNNSLLGGAGNDRFEFASGAQVLANTVVGGNGTDTLVLTAATTIADAQLARVSGVEAIQASSLAGNSITVGANAVAGGVLSLFGGASSDVLSAAGMVSGNIWIQGDAVGGTSTLGDTLIAGIGTSRATLVGNNSSTADNYFQISTASLLGNNSIVGGSNSDDYLQITGSNQTLLDASFAQVSDLNGLILSGGLNSITLGVTAQAKFGATISLTGGGSGADTINLSATTKKVYLDASAGSNGDTITAGTNENTLIGGAAATANDLFIFTSRSHLIGASIVGGGGTDTLRLSANGQTVASADLTGLSSVEVFDLAGAANNITFGNASYGISTIVGGTGPNTLNAASYNSSPNALTWNMNASNGSDVLLGGANGNLFQIKNGANLQNSFITGNTGIDTIQLLAGAQTLGDSAFTNISSVEKLQLGSATNGNSITIGTLAASKGIATVIGGTGRDTIDANGFGKGIWIDASASSGARLIGSTTAPAGNTLIGGAAGGNEFVVGALGANSIFGGSNGQDTLALSTAATIAAGNLTSLSKIGTLEFNAAGNNVVLGVDGLIAGIRTLVGGEGSDDGLGNTFDTSAYFSAGVLFQVTDQDYLSNVNAIVGSTGVDTLKFSRDGVSITDENVANLTNIDVLRTANGNNHFLIHNDFVAAGIDSIIGGTGRDTINMSDNSIYIPTGVADMITMDMSAGSGYTLISSTDDVLIPSQGNFRWAKVIGGLVAGSVILDGTNLADADFEYMYQANIGTLFMNQASDNTVVLGEKARGSGLDTLTMSDGNDNIDVTGFLGALAVNGGLGNDIVDTSFAALASLRFTGGDGDDTLRLVGAEARSITSLTGSYEAFALDDGNNFVVLANDAGLSTIHGGTGFDTISMLNNTTGIHFAMNAEGLGNGSGFASLDGGSGSDTLSLATAPVTFLDDQFSRLGSNAWVGDVGAIENFAAFQGGGGGNTYHFGVFAYAAGISRVYGSVGATAGNRDTFDGSIYGDDELPVRGLEFVFNVANDASGTTSDLSKTDIIGTAQQDTLTITENNQVVADSAFANKTNLEILRLANGSNNVTLNFNANNAGIATVIGGTGNDAFSTSAVAYTINARILGGAGNDVFTGGSGDDTFRGEAGNDTIDAGSGNNVLFGGSENDSLKGGVGIDWLCGTDTTALGANEIDTLTGGGGAGTNTFQLGDSVNTYYDTAKQGGDFALITDFASGDKLQLKLLNGAATGNGYLVGAALYGALGSSNYYLYRDSNNNGALEDGDNLIAGIQTTGGLVLTTANLKSTHGSFV